MTKYNRVIHIPHEPDNLFELVYDIKRYPEFVRWIRKMDVEVRKDEGSKLIRIGSAVVGFLNFRENFVTRVRSDSEARTINVELVKGPLKHLDNSWEFKPAEQGGTNIEFSVDFEFKNIVLRTLASTQFETAVKLIMGAFIAEADRRYKRTG